MLVAAATPGGATQAKAHTLARHPIHCYITMLLRCLTRLMAWLLSCKNGHDPNSILPFHTQAPQNGRNPGLSALMTTR